MIARRFDTKAEFLVKKKPVFVVETDFIFPNKAGLYSFCKRLRDELLIKIKAGSKNLQILRDEIVIAKKQDKLSTYDQTLLCWKNDVKEFRKLQNKLRDILAQRKQQRALREQLTHGLDEKDPKKSTKKAMRFFSPKTNLVDNRDGACRLPVIPENKKRLQHK